MSKYLRYAFFLLILVLGAYLRFSFLDWGKPYFFHPDENNITFAMMHLSLTQWNPHFFAYGGLPIYTTYLLSFLISMGKPSFILFTYMFRFFSASFSFLLILSLFYIGSKLYNRKTGIIAALLATVSVGFIQYAHFGTFEMWLTFFGLWFFYACFLVWHKPTFKHVFFTGLLAGILMSVKVSTSVLLPIPLILFLFNRKVNRNKLFLYILSYLLLIICVFSLTNPFFYLDMFSYISSLTYEGTVASGYLPVFYTQSFLHTVPVIFQFTKIYPFLLNPFVLCAFLFSFFFLLKRIRQNPCSQDILVASFFLIIFFSQAFLFVKWTRYMVPTLPFIYLIIASGVGLLKNSMQYVLSGGLFLLSLLFAISFFITVYPKDSRIAAASIERSTQPALVEPYDLGAVAFSNVFPNSEILNLYDLEKNTAIQQQLAAKLQTDSIFLSPSQRLSISRLKNPADFPKGYLVYKNLFNGLYGFHIEYQTSCNVWCKIAYMGNPLQNVEETATVFDHPFVTIFQKK